jgi:hypothetical protein
MEIAYYSTREELKKDKLLRAIKTALPEMRVSTFSEIEKLKDDLLLGPGSKTLAVLVATTEEALLGIYCIHFLFRSISTILVLPDNDECVQALAFRMKPNFLFYADSKEEDIVSVVVEMSGEIPKTRINRRPVRIAA